MLMGLSVNAQIRAKWTIPADAETGLCSSRTVSGFGDIIYGANNGAGTIDEWKDGQLLASYDVNKFCVDNQLGEMEVQKDEAGVETMYINSSVSKLNTGESTKLEVVIQPENAINKTLSWSSSDESVATVSSDGTVTAISAGRVTITATTTDGSNLSSSQYITVIAADIISNGINYNITSDIEPYTVEVIEGNYTGDIVIPESIEKDEITYTVKSIKSNAFRSCEITSIVIPESIENIGERAFEGCKSLTSIVIPNSVKSINSNTFANCSCLTCVVIPESVSTIGYYAFYYCTSLKNIIIPEGVKAIEDDAFHQCYNLETITLPSTLNSIGGSAFASEVVSGENENGGLVMEEFKRKIICNATTPPTLRSGAFSCNIITMEVPFASMMAYKEDERWARYDITYLSKEVDGQNFVPTSDTEIELSSKNNEEDGYNGDVVIPGEVTIEDQTYTVSSIGESAFADCTEITSVFIPESISTIAGTAFDGCTGLELLDMSESIALTSISSNTFSSCTALETVNFPISIESIGASAFANCANLSNMSLPCTTPPVLDNENNPFEGVDATACIISIPTESVSAYTQSDSWNKFVDPSAKNDIQISVVNNESENENNCTIRFKKFIENTIEPAELMANNIKATLAEDEVVSEEAPDAVTANGQSLFVANGDAVTFYIIPDEATEIDKVIYNETDVTQQVVENTFTTPEVNTKSSLQVILKNGTPTGVEDSFMEDVDVIETARYDISGRLISAPIKGINFVKMSDGTVKKEVVK